MRTAEHYHCPDGCEHPQPFASPDGRILCGRCFFRFGEEVECQACGPETCPDDFPQPTAEPGESPL